MDKTLEQSDPTLNKADTSEFRSAKSCMQMHLRRLV
jgi:hypothetical protein